MEFCRKFQLQVVITPTMKSPFPTRYHTEVSVLC